MNRIHAQGSGCPRFPGGERMTAVPEMDNVSLSRKILALVVIADGNRD